MYLVIPLAAVLILCLVWVRIEYLEAEEYRKEMEESEREWLRAKAEDRQSYPDVDLNTWNWPER